MIISQLNLLDVREEREEVGKEEVRKQYSATKFCGQESKPKTKRKP